MYTFYYRIIKLNNNCVQVSSTLRRFDTGQYQTNSTNYHYNHAYLCEIASYIMQRYVEEQNLKRSAAFRVTLFGSIALYNRERVLLGVFNISRVERFSAYQVLTDTDKHQHIKYTRGKYRGLLTPSDQFAKEKDKS